MTKRVTSFDVARLAGVSQATVSRALRDLPSITPETRERVARAAEQLGYVPHEAGRALSTRVTRRIAIVSEAPMNPFYPELLDRLRERLGERGYRVVLVADSEDDALTAATLTDGSFDGVIITTATRTSRLPGALQAHGLPSVLVNRVRDDPVDIACSFDNREGAARIARLLHELGHCRVGVLAGASHLSTGLEREQGLRDELARFGIDVPDRWTRRIDFDARGGRAAALEVLAGDDRPTALVCGNDYLAFGALNAARALGIAVPEQLTVIGFDDVAMASWDVLDLTTVLCDRDELAAEAVDLITRAIRGLRTGPQVRVPVELRLRGTHAPPPPEAASRPA